MSYHNKGEDRRKEWRNEKKYSQNKKFYSGNSRSHERYRAGYFLDTTKEENSTNSHDVAGPSRISKYRHRGHPSGLKGAQIGLFYRNLQIQKKSKATLKVSLSANTKMQIKELLSSIKSNQSNIVKSELSNEKYEFISESDFKRKFLNTINIGIEEKLSNEYHCSSLCQNTEIDQSLKSELKNKLETSQEYKKMLVFRSKLPSYDKRHDILNLIRENQVVVISGETGCGKTTQVAQFILDECILDNKGSLCKIICTQPRRISAITVAERVAEERGERCGEASVGYQIRLEKKQPRQYGSILFCTTGVLLQQMKSNPALRGISHLILDEIHERDIQSDFIITLLKSVIKKRLDLKLILMSATLNADRFSTYYNNCPCINIPGFTFPVKEYYLEDVLEMTKFTFPDSPNINSAGWRKHLKKNKDKMKEVEEFKCYIEPFIRHLESRKKYKSHTLQQLRNPKSEELNINLVYETLKYICLTQDEGALLIFLPGFSEISQLHKLIINSGIFPNDKYVIVPLHSKMPTLHQKQAFLKPKKGVRKIIIATNIAETSITIDDIVYVIDCGKIKMKNYKVEENLQTLRVEWVSLANAKQRRGRAGRVQAGVCYHLFTKAREMILDQYQLPEMLRSRLDEVILEIKILQLGKAEPFLSNVMDSPEAKAIENSIKLLKCLNALDDEENLTPLGYHLANLPLDPQSGKMILMGALFSCIDPVFSVAASLSFKDAFLLPLGKEKEVDKKKRELSRNSKSDHIVLVEALKQWENATKVGSGKSFCWEYFLSEFTLIQLRDMKRQFAELLHEMNFLKSGNVKAPDSNLNSNNMSLVKAIICCGLYPNVAKISRLRQQKSPKVITIEDGRVDIHPGSVNALQVMFESPFLVYHLKQKSSFIYLHDTSMVHPLPLLFFGDRISCGIEDNGLEIISVNELIKFRCSQNDAELIIKLRRKLNDLLEYKVAHPGFIDWSQKSEAVNILRAIQYLITLEHSADLDEDEEDI